MDKGIYDVVVVGGGAAGLSAALVLGRARRRVAVIDAGTPRNAPAAHMHGYLSRDGLPPGELLEFGRDEASRYGVEFITGHVVSIDPAFAVRLADGETLQGRRLLIATGATDELPEIPGLSGRWAVTSFTAPTATAGKCAISRLVCSAPLPTPSSTHSSSASGQTT
jgi:thioredoxin reductase